MTVTQARQDKQIAPCALFGKMIFPSHPALSTLRMKVNPGLSAVGHLSTFRSNDLETYVFGYFGDKSLLAAQLDIPHAGSGTDAELLAHLYRACGTGCLAKLAGNWAVAVVDRSKQKLILARDHAGTRPLYFTTTNSTFQFATSTEALTPDRSRPIELNREGLHRHLAREFITNRETLQSGINPVPPAHFVVVAPNGVNTERFWEPSEVPRRPSVLMNDAVAELRGLLRTVVSEVVEQPHRLGAHMSGGLDSTAIIAMATETPNLDPLPTYAWQPRPTETAQTDIDGTLANLVSTSFNVQASYLPTTDQDMAEFLATDPVRSPATSTLMTELPVMRQAQLRGVTLIASGWGGDDFISCRGPRLREGLDRHLATLRRKLTRRDPPKDSRQHMIDRLKRGHLPERTDSWSVQGARFGLQYAYPLLDRRLIEFALSMPNRLFVDRLLMRETLRGLVPEAIRSNTDKSDMWRFRHSWNLLEATRRAGLELPVNPERVPMIDNTMFSRYLSQSLLDVEGASDDSADFLTALQFVYDPQGQPYSQCITVDLETLASHDLAATDETLGLIHRTGIWTEATMAVLVADLAVRFLRFSRVARGLGQSGDGAVSGRSPRPLTREELMTAVEIGDATERISKRLPHRPLCLPQAIATHQLLRRRGVPSTLKLGVKMNPPGEAEPIAAHAWVAVDEKVVNGKRDYRKYTVTNTFTTKCS